jgi:hypothetical protein
MAGASMATAVPGTAGLSGRDRALLRAVADGRCQFRGGCGWVLLVDGLACSDFSAAPRLVDAGLLAVPDAGVALAPAVLTPAGRAALGG